MKPSFLMLQKKKKAAVPRSFWISFALLLPQFNSQQSLLTSFLCVLLLIALQSSSNQAGYDKVTVTSPWSSLLSRTAVFLLPSSLMSHLLCPSFLCGCSVLLGFLASASLWNPASHLDTLPDPSLLSVHMPHSQGFR